MSLFTDFIRHLILRIFIIEAEWQSGGGNTDSRQHSNSNRFDFGIGASAIPMYGAYDECSFSHQRHIAHKTADVPTHLLSARPSYLEIEKKFMIF